MLTDSGYDVVGEAGSVREAIACARVLEPDTALVDIGLPDGLGFSLARRLSAMPRPVQVVLISTDADGASPPAARDAGACGFLAKEELSVPALRRLIEGG